MIERERAWVGLRLETVVSLIVYVFLKQTNKLFVPETYLRCSQQDKERPPWEKKGEISSTLVDCCCLMPSSKGGSITSFAEESFFFFFSYPQGAQRGRVS